jgi:uncharacterized protein (TIGR02391 family)
MGEDFLFAMEKIEPFSSDQLEAICRIVGDTTQGLTGTQIERFLEEMRVPDIHPFNTKWKRLFNALASVQNQKGVGNHTIMLITRVMKPTNFLNNQERFDWFQTNLNMALAFCGFRVRDDGQIERTSVETTLAGARKRASRLRATLAERNVHDEVLKYCRAELLEENYFHAILEATKSVAQRIREISTLTGDGAELVNAAFSTKNPVLKINALSNETEISEQKGFSNLLVGLFGAIRNPVGHAPRIHWPISEQDALDILTFISFLHRKLDKVT